jgi:phosphate starvation-inducible PhoH-like protein
MKMFLTRLGFNSKMIVTGDVTQIDLPGGNSGLKIAKKILSDVDDMQFCVLDSSDVVRHSLVGKIVDAYSKFEEKQGKTKGLPGRNR